MARVGWLDDPDVLLDLVLFELLVVVVEVPEFLGKDVSIRAQIKRRFAVFVLHSDNVVTQAVFARDFKLRRKFVKFLVLVEALILIGFQGA